MQLNLIFRDDDVFKLHLTVWSGNKQYEIKAIRWIQFIALLVYCRLPHVWQECRIAETPKLEPNEQFLKHPVRLL